MTFYQRPAHTMRDALAREVSKGLAREERGHAEAFLDRYRDVPRHILAEGLERRSDVTTWLHEPKAALDGGVEDLRAPELPMRKERQLETALAQRLRGQCRLER